MDRRGDDARHATVSTPTLESRQPPRPAQRDTPVAYTLLFVDDHPLYREGLKRVVEEVLPEARVLVTDTPAAALACLAAEPDVDLFLTDYRLPDQDGLSLVAEVGRRHPTAARGLLCADPTVSLVERARGLGCVACLSKDRNMEEIAEALSVLFAGGTVFDGAAANGAEHDALSAKRIEILQLAADGQSNKEIARTLGIAERTVKDHWHYIFDRLQVGNRAEAISRAHRLNLLR